MGPSVEGNNNNKGNNDSCLPPRHQQCQIILLLVLPHQIMDLLIHTDLNDLCYYEYEISSQQG